MRPVPVAIYEHTNFRQYLKAWFEDRKGRPSVRGFAKKVGCSPALLSSIMSGTRDLAAAMVERVADGLGLDPDEKTYFQLLVEWEQGGTVKARRQALDRLMALRRFKAARRIEDTLYLVFSRWYYPAIVELSRCVGFREDPAWIAATLMPPITPEEAAEALDVLVGCGFLAPGPDGRLRPVDVTWATEHEVDRITGHLLADMHRWLLARAPQALEEFAPTERHFGTLSLALTPAAYTEAKAAVARFEEEMLARFGGVEAPGRVFQLSVQLFPLSRPTGS